MFGRPSLSAILCPERIGEMDACFDEIVADAMALPEQERVLLARELIASLDEELNPDVEELWPAEAERRLEELRSGKVQGVPAEEAFARVRKSLHR